MKYKIKWNYQDLAYGPDANQKMDMVIPKEKEVHGIVYIHGGAYMTGNKAEYPSFLADYSENNLAASMDYRLINTDNDICMADILSDVDDALVKIVQVSKADGVTVKDFILAGHSAGGHIGLLYGYGAFQKKQPMKIAACISLAGPADFTDDSGWSSMTMWGRNLEERLSFLSRMGSRLTGGTIELTQRGWTGQKNYPAFEKYIRDISPIAYISKTREIPPTLLVHARGDNQVPYSNSVRLNAALDYASIPHKLITPSGLADNHILGGESYTDNSPILFINRNWVKEAREWLETYLR
jgi:acetyl esterase/lipase